MAYDEFSPDAEDQEAAGITVFGMTLSPPVLGVLIAAAGLGLSVWLGINYVKPLFEKTQALQGEIESLKDKLSRKEEIKKQIEAADRKLAEVKGIQTNVLGMFTNASNLETLLLDLNQEIDRRNPQLTAEAIQDKLETQGCPGYVVKNYTDIDDRVEGFFANAKLTKFEPQVPKSSSSATAAGGSDGFELVQDSSLGAQANNQIKRQTAEVELQGNFDQILQSIRRLEQFQSLLMLSELKAEVEPQSILVDANGPLKSCQPETTLKMAFKLNALLPLNQEELKAMMAPPEEEGEEAK